MDDVMDMQRRRKRYLRHFFVMASSKEAIAAYVLTENRPNIKHNYRHSSQKQILFQHS